jgi:hypothetical protein
MFPSGRAAKARFARFLAASDRETRFLEQLEVASPGDPSGRLEPKRGLSGSEAYGCPPGNSRKARFTRFLAASDRETRFSSSRRLRSQLICLVT